MLSFNMFGKSREQSQEHKTAQDLIAQFHAKHAELEDIGNQLHASGHFIEIDYHSAHAARHGRVGSTLFFNAALKSAKKIRISKSAINPNIK